MTPTRMFASEKGSAFLAARHAGFSMCERLETAVVLLMAFSASVVASVSAPLGGNLSSKTLACPLRVGESALVIMISNLKGRGLGCRSRSVRGLSAVSRTIGVAAGTGLYALGSAAADGDADGQRRRLCRGQKCRRGPAPPRPSAVAQKCGL